MKNLLNIALIFLLSACTINYGMIDGSIDADTFSVELFEEQASNAPAGYGATYTDFLKDYMISRTKLNLKNQNADIEISGKIIQYNTSPVSVQTDEVAALNRLTVVIAVTVVNNLKEEDSFESNFRQFSDYSADQDLASVEEELLSDINDKLSQDIINRLTSNW
ncbi:MAG: LPS assembly lipoprotein LptE [Flavobacteriales bacterium]|nr:LPS assembly lipoprotein LptE [Flavobacteriales bacterium]